MSILRQQCVILPHTVIDRTALHWAACFGNKGLVKLLMQERFRTNLNAQDNKGMTPAKNCNGVSEVGMDIATFIAREESAGTVKEQMRSSSVTYLVVAEYLRYHDGVQGRKMSRRR